MIKFPQSSHLELCPVADCYEMQHIAVLGLRIKERMLKRFVNHPKIKIIII